MAEVTPFTISIPQARLDRLQAKLALTDLPTDIQGAGWEYGAPLPDITRLLSRWRSGYDWRAAEKRLNTLPQYTLRVPIDGFETLTVHFAHVRSEVPGAVPLLFAHGWPGSFAEGTKIAEQLVKGSPAFNVVIPSLPGFGFSEGSSKKSFTVKQMAEACHKIMLALGYTQYVTQGGDIGMSVTRWLGLSCPESCKANHLNFSIPLPPTIADKDLFFESQSMELSKHEKAGLERSKWFLTEGYGYSSEHSTKPQTIGYSLADSPIGLLAWVYEKLHDWTDSYPWTDDEVLTWVSIYYFSVAGPAKSVQIYYENSHDGAENVKKTRSYIPDVKLGCSHFPVEIMQMPLLWDKTLGPLVFQKVHDKGGHFAAWERPDDIVADLREMFGKDGGAYAVVKGHTGYSG